MQIRRKYIIDARFQMRFTLLFILISIAGNILAVTAFNTFAMKQLDAVLWSTHIGFESTDELLRPIFLYVNGAGIIFISLMMLAAGYVMMKKTSGPLFRMSRDLEKITDGDLSARITLRKQDELRDIADDLNRMTEKLQEHFASLKKDYDQVAASVHSLAGGTPDREDARRQCAAAREAVRQVKDKLGRLDG